MFICGNVYTRTLRTGLISVTSSEKEEIPIIIRFAIY